MPRTALATPPTTGTIAEFLLAQLDADLVPYPGDQAKYERLTKLRNIWTARRADFIAASEDDGDLPRIFYYGPHLGWISATDFLVVLSDIDRRKTELERAPAVPRVASPSIRVGDHTAERSHV